MDNSHNSGSWRSYSDVLLEEIALEGLDGITIELLWNRLKVNPEWKLSIDEFTEEFIWKILIRMDHLNWYELKKPRESPPVFASTEEMLQAVESNKVDVVNFSIRYYPHHLINDGNVIGSCSTFHERNEVTDEIRTLTVKSVTSKFGNRLVLVASQCVRNSVLISSDTNPSFEIPELSYCILERIGRGRRCGEFSVALNVLRNGANPTFYFWSRLRKINIIKTQPITHPKQARGTLIHLTRLYKLIPSEIANLVLQIVEKIESSPVKMMLFSEAQDLFASCKAKKISKSDVFRRYLKFCFVPYEQYYPETSEKKVLLKNGGPKLVRVLQIVNENHRELLIGDPDENVHEIVNEVAFLENHMLRSRTSIFQCFNVVREAGANGLTMVDIERKLGVGKLMARMLLKALQKSNLIFSASSDDARIRVYRYYLKDYYDVVKSKIEKQVTCSEIMDTSGFDEMNSTMSTVPDMTKQSILPVDEVRIHNENSEANENTESGYSHETSGFSEISEIPSCSKTSEATKRQSSTDIIKLDGTSVKRPKLEDALSQDFVQTQIMSAMSESIKCSIPAGESVFVMRRINIVLSQVYKFEVVLRSCLIRLITEEESKRGISQGVPCRKSLIKIVNILSNSGKVKIIKKSISNEASKKTRELEFLCIPTATENHPIIQAAVDETRNALSVVYVASGSKTTPKSLDYQPRKKSNQYGYCAKFNRMKILHELITYIVYHYDGQENLDPEESKEFVRPLLGDSESVDDLPTIYKKEVNWKMFIPPLMPFEEYGDGWISQNDLAERIPLKLFLNLIRVPYDHPDIHAYLKHPIKRYYLLRHLPQDLQVMLSVDKKYLYSLCLNLRLLCYIGLCQFGPKNRNRGFQNLVYVNKRAQLMDTRLSAPGYAFTSSNVQYPIVKYNLTEAGSVEVYWNDSLRFAIGTKLGRNKYAGEKVKSKRMPERMAKIAEARTFEEVLQNDNGELPGDKRGAAGYDSWMFAHKHNQWFLNKYEGKTDKSKDVPNAPKKPKLPLKVPPKPVSKLMRYRHQVIRNRDYNRAKISYDNVDMDALSKMQTLRAKWSKNEDEILLMGHLASKYYTKPVIYMYRPYILIRKILHSLVERSRDKTVHACKRRIVNLMKNPLKQHSFELCLKEMLANAEMKDRFRALCEDIDKAYAARDTPETKASMDKLTEEVFYYLYESKKISISSKGTMESLPDSIDTFRESFDYEYATPKGADKYLELKSKNEISTLLVVNLIFSALYSQVDKSKTLNTGLLYAVFKQFDNVYLKSALHYVRSNRLISNNKCMERNRGLLLPIGGGVFHLSLTYHLLLKVIYRTELFNCIYSKILELCSHVDDEFMKINHFDAGLSTILIAHCIQDSVQFQIEVPEFLLQFNETPIVYDESILARAVVQAKKFSEATLSLVSEKYPNADRLEKVANEHNAIMVEDDTMVDDGDDDEEEDRLVDFSVSNISIYITRNQFKYSDVRFSNAYDHYLLNTFSISYRIDEKTLQQFDCVNRTLFLAHLEDAVMFKKIRYSTNELQQKVRKYFHEAEERDLATSVLEFLLIKGICGVSTTEFSTEFSNMRLLKKVVTLLVRKKLIIRDGSVNTRFVHINFGEHWLLRTCNNKNIFEAVSSDRPPSRKSDDAFTLNESNDPLYITIRPWVHFNGTINEPALDSILTRVLSYIIKVPGLSLIGVQKKFLPALQPHCVRELLEFLEQLNCIRSFIFARKNKPSLFSKSLEYALEDEVLGFEDEDSIIYEPLPHALLAFSVFLSSTNKKDLLETKYSTGKNEFLR